MREIIGFIIILLGVVLGIYVGGYVLLYGGIMQIYNNLDPFVAKEVFLGVIRVLLCELGWFVFALFGIIGGAIATSK